MLLIGCTKGGDRSKGVYMLIDTSGTYAEELQKAQSVINYLLGTLQPGDTLAVGRIDTGSFSENDIIAKVQFDSRPSVANTQKRTFKKTIDEIVTSVTSSNYTDISGGILQAIEYLNEKRTRHKYILIFSDMKEDLAKGHVRDVSFQLSGFKVVALYVTKLPEDILDPKKYLARCEDWQKKVEVGGGQWERINDLDHLDNLFIH
jgi:hypothetical protein